MTLQTHRCAVERCSEACPLSHLMCVRHWRMVPAELRRNVFTAYRGWVGVRRRKGIGGAAAGELGAAQAAAIAAVREKEVRKQRRIEELQKPLAGFEP